MANANGLQCLHFLLKFLAAWEKRPAYLTPIAYKWCSAISEVAGTGLQPLALFTTQPYNMNSGDFLPQILEERFPLVGPGCDPVRMGEASHHTREYPQGLIGFHPQIFLFVALGVGFRQFNPGRDQPALPLDHTPFHDLVFQSAFSSHDDEVIADGVCAWIADSTNTPAGLCAHYLARYLESDRPFSPRLRQMSIRLIEYMWRSRPWVLEGDNILLLNYLTVGVDDIDDRDAWVTFLVDAICSPEGLRGLSIHYWRLLEGLPPARDFPEARAMELVGSLEEVEDWEKLENLMIVAWQSNAYACRGPDRSKYSERLEKATLKHLQRRPSALPRFEGLPRSRMIRADKRAVLKDICVQARTVQLPLETLPP